MAEHLLCPNCGAEMEGTTCAFCGYLHTEIEDAEHIKNSTSKGLSLALPNMFTKKVDNKSEVTTWTYKNYIEILGTVGGDEAYYLKPRVLKESWTDNLSGLKLKYSIYYLDEETPEFGKFDHDDLEDFDYVIDDCSYHGLPSNIEDLKRLSFGNLSSMKVDVVDLSKEDMRAVQRRFKVLYAAIVNKRHADSFLEETSKEEAELQSKIAEIKAICKNKAAVKARQQEEADARREAAYNKRRMYYKISYAIAVILFVVAMCWIFLYMGEQSGVYLIWLGVFSLFAMVFAILPDIIDNYWI